MDSRERDFLAEIRLYESDDAPRLVYADWLSGQGDPRGELIAVQCAETVNRQRELELLELHGAQWLAPLGADVAASDPEQMATWFERGFLEGLVVRELADDALFRLSPLIYRPDALISDGHFTDVYLASALDVRGRVGRVAVKRRAAGGPKSTPRPWPSQPVIDWEAGLLSEIDDPHVVSLLGRGLWGTDRPLVLEWVNGPTLEDLLALRAPARLGSRIAVLLGLQICEALEAVHAICVHREVRPDHVVISRDGSAKLIDFGWAWIPDGPHPLESIPMSPAQQMDVGRRYGYLAPEVVQGTRFDARSDLFSLGAVLYEIVCGRSPFLRPQMMQMFRAIMEGAYPPASEIERDVDPGLERVLARALTRAVEERYADARHMAADLREVAERNGWETGPEPLRHLLWPEMEPSGEDVDRTFWEQRWQSARIGFHQDEVNGHLARHLHQLTGGETARVLVPLCGKSKDMLWLAREGHRVIGVEFVEQALYEFFADESLTYHEEHVEGRLVLEGHGVRLVHSDIRGVEASLIGEVDAVYDRAALIALPPDVRAQYARKLSELTSPGARMLLVTVDYQPGIVEGPPFSIVSSDLTELFGEAFEVASLDSKESTQVPASFREAGVTIFTERVWLLTRRG